MDEKRERTVAKVITTLENPHKGLKLNTVELRLSPLQDYNTRKPTQGIETMLPVDDDGDLM
jgi:hypothetical protein